MPPTLPPLRPAVLVADADVERRRWLRGCLDKTYSSGAVATGADALDALRKVPGLVLVLGDRLADMTAAELLSRARVVLGDAPTTIVVTSDAGAPPLDDPAVFYTVPPGVGGAEVRALIDRACQTQHARTHAGPRSPTEAVSVQRVLEHARRLGGQREPRNAAGVAVDAVLDLADADRAQCLYYDSDSGTLWVEGGSDDERTAAAGIAGYSARAGLALSLARAADDPRYRRAIDDPEGSGDDRLLTQPVAGPTGEVHAVLVAARGAKRPPFTAAEVRSIATLADQWGPLLEQLSLQVQAETVLEEARREDENAVLFRREAVDAYTNRGRQGDVVRVSPHWIDWTYRVLVLVLLSGVAYAAIGTIDQYSSGPGVVRLEGRTEVTATSAGKVESIEVVAGQNVTRGQVLAHLHDATEAADFEQIDREWEARLRDYLLDPTNDGARRAFAETRLRRERALARIEERVVRATTSGVVSDLRARPGQQLAPGDALMSLVQNDTELYVIAMLPGGDLPMIKPGMRLRLELMGHAYAYQTLQVDAVAEEVIGPGEARRYLGPQVADAVALGGPVALVKAALPHRTFEADGKTYEYRDGMYGLAEVRVRSESILKTLIPGLKRLM
jgi:membrane fusion protein (multidrug efflux system)